MEETIMDQVVKATGLPELEVKEALEKWILEAGKSPQDMNLEDFREVLRTLILNLMNDVADGNNDYISLSG